MSVAAQGHAHGVSAERQLRMLRFGFGLFLLAEAMMFVTLFSTRFVLAGSSRPGDLNQWLAGLVSVVMVASVLPARGVVRAHSRGEERAMLVSLGVLALAAALVLAAVGWEWSALGVPAASRYGGIFLAAAGVHAAHVFAALVVFAGVGASARRGRLTSFMVEAAMLFWLFVVGAWLGLWAVFYLA